MGGKGIKNKRLPTNSRIEAFSFSGLTLLETLLSVAILGILTSGIVNAITRFQAKNDLDLSVLIEVESLRRAEELARAVSEDSNWGVKLATGTVTIFKGASFYSRDSTFDETVDISSDISITGSDEFVFTRLAATTTALGTTTMLHTLINEPRTVSVNVKGAIEY